MASLGVNSRTRVLGYPPGTQRACDAQFVLLTGLPLRRNAGEGMTDNEVGIPRRVPRTESGVAV
eukprot:1310452-Rhodomonas_salina.1